MEITEGVARKIVELVDCGLVHGLGSQKPGKMCVEAVVCHALGLPHGDDPQCVAPPIRALKIRLNDSRWSSDKARGQGLKRLALAQLGSKDAIDEKTFRFSVAELVIKTSLVSALRAAAKRNPKHSDALNAAADRCAKDGDRSAALAARTAADAAAAYAAADAADAAADAAAAYAADAAAYAAYAARDKILSDFAEGVVQILIKLKSPGCKWLYLTEGK